MKIVPIGPASVTINGRPVGVVTELRIPPVAPAQKPAFVLCTRCGGQHALSSCPWPIQGKV